MHSSGHHACHIRHHTLLPILQPHSVDMLLQVKIGCGTWPGVDELQACGSADEPAVAWVGVNPLQPGHVVSAVVLVLGKGVPCTDAGQCGVRVLHTNSKAAEQAVAQFGADHSRAVRFPS
jgi:hypothetical protein